MSTVPVPRPVVPLPAAPTPLSPQSFTGSDPGNTAPATTDATLTQSDRATLGSAQTLLKAARAAVASGDSKVAASGKRQLEAVVSYLVGFFDSKGLTSAAPVKPGFETVFGAAAKPDLETALNELDTILAQTLATADTRSILKQVAGVLGEICTAIGAALIIEPITGLL